MYSQSSAFFTLKQLSMAFMMVCFLSCSKTDTQPGNAPALTGFSFTQSSNTIPVNSTGVINGTRVTIFLPPGTVSNSLKASFQLSGNATATVSGLSQQSGLTPNDFTKPVTYTISSDGQSQNYTVELITDLQPIDELVTAFMAKYKISGMAMSITKDNRLVYTEVLWNGRYDGRTTRQRFQSLPAGE